MRSISALILLALLAACSSPPVAAPEAPARPDILLVSLDTFRADAMGAYGNRFRPTPNLDALASAGVRFDRAFTVTPLTIPAHSSIHTGLYPPQHGVRDNGDFYLSDDAVTLAETLKGAGYETMAAVGAEVTSHHWGFAQGFDAYFDELGPVAPGESRWKVERPGADVLADALGWLDTPRDAPTFAWVHFFDAHHPYEPLEPFAGQFPDRPYLGEVAGVDALVGQLLAAVGEDTLVVVVADHGESLGEHGEALHGTLLYNATMRIPMLIRGPDIAPAVVFTPMSLVDVAPTLLGLAGVDAPPMAGLNVASALRGGAEWPASRDIYMESLYAWRHYGWAPQHGMVDADLTLIDSTTDKLFAHDDAYQKTDLAPADPRLSGMVSRLATFQDGLESSGLSAPVTADAALAEQLAALGYTTAVAEVPTGPLADPEDRLGSLSRLETVRQAARAGDLDAAQAAADRLMVDDPGLMEPRILLAKAYLRAGRYAEARQIARDALSRDDSATFRVVAGRAELSLGNRPAGMANLEAAVRMDPGVVQSWVVWLGALLEVGDAARLRAESARALQTLPEQPEVRAMAAIGLALTGEVDAAEPLLLAVLAEGPGTPLVRHGLGTVAQERAQSETAERWYRDEIAQHPPGLPSRRHLAALYAAQGDFAEQLTELTVIYENEPPSPVTRYAIAQARFNLGEYDAALEDALICRQLAPGLPECAMLQANTLQKLGREDDALAALSEARALHAERTRP